MSKLLAVLHNSYFEKTKVQQEVFKKDERQVEVLQHICRTTPLKLQNTVVGAGDRSVLRDTPSSGCILPRSQHISMCKYVLVPSPELFKMVSRFWSIRFDF